MQAHARPITRRQRKSGTGAGAEALPAPALAAGRPWLGCAKGTLFSSQKSWRCVPGSQVRESTSSPSYPESGFLPQNCSKAQRGCEGKQRWAAFIANVCRGAEYLARRGLSEMPAVFRRGR